MGRFISQGLSRTAVVHVLRTALDNILKTVKAELELQDAINKAQLPEQMTQVTLKVLIDQEGAPKAAFAYLPGETKSSDLRILADLLGIQIWVFRFHEKITATSVEDGEVIPLLKEELDAFVELIL